MNKVNQKTGEIIQTNEKQYKGVIFKLESNRPTSNKEGNKRLIIEFKPHYWHNGNQHNANDFTPNQSISTIRQFINLFGLRDFNKYKIVNLEFGVNFLINGYDKDLVLYHSFHSRNRFLHDRHNKYSMISYSFNRKGKPNKNVQIKFYSKGFHYPKHCPKETLRFEISSKQSKKINLLGIHNIGDFLKIDTYHCMKSELLKQSQKVLILEHKPNSENLSKKEKNKLKEQSNPYYWNQAINQKRQSSFNEKKEIYFKYLDKTGLNINRLFVESINIKLDQLFKKNSENSTHIKKKKNSKNSTMLKVEYVAF